MKKVLSTAFLAVAAIVIVTLIIIGVFLNHIVKKAVEIYGPRLTQTTVAVDSVNLSLLTGSAQVKGLAVGNPQGYKTPHSFAVGQIAVGLSPMSVFSRKIVIHSIRVESPNITFEGGLTGNNLSQILDNVNSAGKGAGPVSTNAAAAAPKPQKPQKKLEVDDLVISGAKVQVVISGIGMSQPQVIPLPDIHLTDLGKGGDGITAADLTGRVLKAISNATLQAVAQTAASLDKNSATLKRAGQHAVKQLGNTLSNFFNK